MESVSIFEVIDKDQTYPPFRVVLPRVTRIIVLQWMMQVANDLLMSRYVFHRAAELFDRIYAIDRNHKLEENRWVGIGCLTVADEIQNRDRIRPKRLWISSLLPSLTQSEISKAEGFVLENIDWSIDFHTAEGHLEALAKSIYMDSGNRGLKNRYFEQMKQVLDLCTLDKHCRQFTPLTVAVAILHQFCANYPIDFMDVFFFEIDMKGAIEWVMPFLNTVRREGIGVDCTIQGIIELSLVEAVQKEVRMRRNRTPRHYVAKRKM